MIVSLFDFLSFFFSFPSSFPSHSPHQQVGHDATRKIASKIFLDLQDQDLSFHLGRQTGALSRAIERGSRGIMYVMNAMVFNLIPTALEIGK